MATKVFTKEKWEQVNNDNKHLLNDFVLEMKSNRKSIHTISQYVCDLRMIFCHIYDDMDNQSVLYMNKKDFRRIKMWLIEERQVSSARCCRIMSAIHSMLDYAEDDDDYEYDYNTSKKVKGLSKEAVREIIFLSDEEIKRLRNELQAREKYKYMALLDLMYDSAGRRRELLQVERFNLLSKNCTNIVRGKGGKQFPLVYFNRTLESLKLYLDTREDDLPELWVSGEGDDVRAASYHALYEWVLYMRKVYEDISGEYVKFTPHSFRHSALQNMKDGTHYICKEINQGKGFELGQLKVYAHHNDTGTTELYLKNNDGNVLFEMFGIKIS